MMITNVKNFEPVFNNYTRCLLDVHKALNSLSLPWFITHGTALMYWRSKSFISSDMDIAVFYNDLKLKNITDKEFVKNMMKNYGFKLKKRYGDIDHGREWSFLCPMSRISIDVFVFYRFNETDPSSDYWKATYNGLCNKMIYKKCRWKFTNFNLTKFEMYRKQFNIVPLEFIIERYGKDYMIPKTYDYFQGLKILPNLIQEYSNKSL